MDWVSLWVALVFSLLFSVLNSEQDVRVALVEFMAKLCPMNTQSDPNWGWNASSDPCTDKWAGVTCDTKQQSVKKIVLDQFNLTGVLDASYLCQASDSLLVLSLNDNNVAGDLPEEISACKYITHLYLRGNRFSGSLPSSLSLLSNLKRLDISNNNFSEALPDMSRIMGLLTFLGQNNWFSGKIPQFDFFNLVEFNVSNNNLSGKIPDVEGHFNASSFLGNPRLCGEPLSNSCSKSRSGKKSKNSLKYLILSGFFVLGLILVIGVAITVIKNKKPKAKKKKKKTNVDAYSGGSSEFKTGGNRSEYSITSAESGLASSSLVVLSSTPVVNGMRFEDMLRAPAELIERGKHGSLYKVVPNEHAPLVVKRIKDWGISKEDFKKRMVRVNQVKYCQLLHIIVPSKRNSWFMSISKKAVSSSLSMAYSSSGSQNGQLFDWESRISIAASIAKALAFMHEELRVDKIAHGNLKSTNILLKDDMGPCISEYGLMVVENQGLSFYAQADNLKKKDPTGGQAYSTFKVDIYRFGVILLELLTGKLVENCGFDLATWVHSVVKEEWTGEVFDKSLVRDGASEESMVSLLQVALKCINQSPEARPSMGEVAAMINSIREEEEERSTTSSQLRSLDETV